MKKVTVRGDVKIPRGLIPRIVCIEYCERSDLYTFWFDNGVDGALIEQVGSPNTPCGVTELER